MEDEFISLRQDMVENRLKFQGISDKKILEAFFRIPRENFVRPPDRSYAYLDRPLHIGYDQTISQPYVVALMTQLLAPKRNDTILEIGSGSGYQSAILSCLCKQVISYEIVSQLAQFAKDNLKKTGIENVVIRSGDGGADLKPDETFDRMIVTAAVSVLPETWSEHLKEGGILVIPEGKYFSQILMKYKKVHGKLKLIDESVPVRFVPLTGKYGT